MENELKILYEIQKTDLKIMETERKLALGPKKIEELDFELRQLKEKIDKEKIIIDELEKERRRKERELDEEREKIKKKEARLFEVKTNKEYQAMLKEIEMAKEALDKLEEDILILMDRIEELKKDYQESVKYYEKRKKEIEEEKRSIQNDLSTLDEQIAVYRTEKERLMNEISPELKERYNIIREKRQGIAVVNVKNGVCLGCYVNIPPQLFIEVTKNNQIISCPNCNRIFYYIDEK
ncbi:MAG: C4-type zinc ribbon domain-containing protein [Desulfobacterota bacterium]|nr:C4-type zinc ribbon domain-containing protein [Thermodesulfobacteriota bacterium]MDW8001070.1 C4-type zinc ribbon domain-containing protein [Deltaproteobacteria bacterium]